MSYHNGWGIGLVFTLMQIQFSAKPLLTEKKLSHVAHTPLPLSPNSIIWQKLGG